MVRGYGRGSNEETIGGSSGEWRWFIREDGEWGWEWGVTSSSSGSPLPPPEEEDGGNYGASAVWWTTEGERCVEAEEFATLQGARERTGQFHRIPSRAEWGT